MWHSFGLLKEALIARGKGASIGKSFSKSPHYDFEIYILLIFLLVLNA